MWGRHPLSSSGQGNYFLYPLEVLGRSPAHLPLIVPALVRKSSCMPHSGFGNVTVQGDGGRNHRARASTVSAVDLSAQEGRSRKEGSAAESTRHFLYCSRIGDNGRPLRDLLVPHLSPEPTPGGSCHPPRPRVG